jgi:hypothetical protein
VSPVGRDISGGPRFYQDGFEIPFNGLRQKISLPFQAQINLRTVRSFVIVTFGHKILVTNFAGMDPGDGELEMATLLGQYPFIKGINDGILLFEE